MNRHRVSCFLVRTILTDSHEEFIASSRGVWFIDVCLLQAIVLFMSRVVRVSRELIAEDDLKDTDHKSIRK